MPPRAIRDPAQTELLDWQPPEPVARFRADRVRGETLSQIFSRAVAAALADADNDGVTREEIARRMSEFLGERISLNMLNAYASPARTEHGISLTRFVALLHATRDARLLQVVADQIGMAVIEPRYLPLIALASVQERQDELRRQAEVLRREARARGAL